MFKHMDQVWEEWTQLNVSRGCDKEGITKILFEHGFDPLLIATKLRYFPRSPELIAAINNSIAQSTLVTPNLDRELAAYQAFDAIDPPLFNSFRHG